MRSGISAVVGSDRASGKPTLEETDESLLGEETLVSRRLEQRSRVSEESWPGKVGDAHPHGLGPRRFRQGSALPT